MARGIEGNEVSTPKTAPKKSTASSQSNKGQTSLLGFFQKKATPTPQATEDVTRTKPAQKTPFVAPRSSVSLTPAPSSDNLAPSSPAAYSSKEGPGVTDGKNKENGLPSPITPAEAEADGDVAKVIAGVDYSSPSRKVCHCTVLSPSTKLTTRPRPRKR